MRMDRALAKAAATVALGGLLAAGYLLVARPHHMQWGATAAEVARPMPGDTLSRNPTFLATRAITIDRTPQEIWPWLVQMGYGLLRLRHSREPRQSTRAPKRRYNLA